MKRYVILGLLLIAATVQNMKAMQKDNSHSFAIQWANEHSPFVIPDSLDSNNASMTNLLLSKCIHPAKKFSTKVSTVFLGFDDKPILAIKQNEGEEPTIVHAGVFVEEIYKKAQKDILEELKKEQQEQPSTPLPSANPEPKASARWYNTFGFFGLGFGLGAFATYYCVKKEVPSWFKTPFSFLMRK